MATQGKPDRVRYQVFVKPEVSVKIDELAERLNMSRSNFLERLLEEGLKDNEWAIRAVTAPIVRSIRDVLVRGKGRSAKEAT